MLMIEPTYSKAFSEYYGDDFQRKPIDQFKMENEGVVGILDEIARPQDHRLLGDTPTITGPTWPLRTAERARASIYLDPDM
jgi:hypothetical protein